jgi:AcrR family transcriptional regulator
LLDQQPVAGPSATRIVTMSSISSQSPKSTARRRAPKNPAPLEDAPRKGRNRERTRQEILDAAHEEFSALGLSGANTVTIANRISINKRLIFYYFKTKEELFTAVLEQAYSRMRDAERELNLDAMAPQEALRKLVHFTFDFDHTNPDFVRLVAIENIHEARHLKRSLKARKLTRPIIEQIERLLARGVETQEFRPGIDATELHMLISAMCFFSVSNRHTFAPQFGYDMSSAASYGRRKALITDAIERYVRADFDRTPG